MNIGFLRYSLYNRGGDRMVIEYANHLARQGHAVTFHVAEVDTVLTIDPGVIIDHRPMSKLRFLAYTATTNFNHQALVVDIIHLPLLAGLRNRIVYFAQADDVEYSGNPAVRAAVDMLYRQYFSGKPSVITVCESLTNAFRERYGFNGSRTVTNGIDLDTFFTDPDQDLVARKEGRKALLFMVRGDVFRKGIDLGKSVIQELSRLNVPNLEVWICGEHYEGQGLDLPVRNYGVVSDARLRQILSSADIFFYPSRHEGFGLFPLEAMACGCAAVTTEAIPYASGIPCIATTKIGDVGAMTAGIARLVSDDPLLRAVQTESIAVAQTYDIRKSQVAFEAALQDLIAEAAR